MTKELISIEQNPTWINSRSSNNTQRIDYQKSYQEIELEIKNLKSITKVPNVYYIEEVSFGNTITEIKDSAFRNAYKLTKTHNTDSVLSVGEYGFYSCNSLSTYFQNLEFIGKWAFAHTSLLSVDLSKIEKILDGTFSGTSKLNSGKIRIGKNITEIGERAFYDTGISEIEVDEDNEFFASKDGILYDKTFTKLLCYPKEKTGDVFFLDENVTEIAPYAFSNSKYLRKIVLLNENCIVPEKPGISKSCFYVNPTDVSYYKEENDLIFNLRLNVEAKTAIIRTISTKDGKSRENLTIPKSIVVSNIDFAITGCERNFNNIEGIKYLTIEAEINAIEKIGKTNSLVSVVLPSSLKTIGEYAFNKASNLSLIIGTSITSLCCSAIKGIKKLTFANGCKTKIVADYNAFEDIDYIDFGLNNTDLSFSSNVKICGPKTISINKKYLNKIEYVYVADGGTFRISNSLTASEIKNLLLRKTLTFHNGYSNYTITTDNSKIRCIDCFYSKAISIPQDCESVVLKNAFWLAKNITQTTIDFGNCKNIFFDEYIDIGRGNINRIIFSNNDVNLINYSEGYNAGHGLIAQAYDDTPITIQFKNMTKSRIFAKGFIKEKYTKERKKTSSYDMKGTNTEYSGLLLHRVTSEITKTICIYSNGNKREWNRGSHQNKLRIVCKDVMFYVNNKYNYTWDYRR